jgi:hypothetical protein
MFRLCVRTLGTIFFTCVPSFGMACTCWPPSFLSTRVGLLALINYVIFNLLLKFTYISSLCWTLGTNFFYLHVPFFPMTCTCWPLFLFARVVLASFLFTRVGLALTNYVTLNILLNLSHKF